MRKCVTKINVLLVMLLVLSLYIWSKLRIEILSSGQPNHFPKFSKQPKDIDDSQIPDYTIPLSQVESEAQKENAPSESGATCQKVKHFVMIKTEKTGSSTLFSILARFILTHNLNVMVMTKGGHLDVTKHKGDHPGWDIGPNNSVFADALIHHSRYNDSLLRRVMHPDTKYITLVRNAASWLESAIRFWPGQVKFKSPDEILGTPELFYLKRSDLKDEYNGQKTLFHLSQLQWLGFNYDHHDNMTAIEKYIKQIVTKFDVTFLTDQFDASLIRMRRQFCWHHADIFYKAQEVGGRVKRLSTTDVSLPLSAEGVQRLLKPEANLGEQLLYEEFNKTWWDNSDTSNPDFWAEVKHFQSTNAKVEKQCKSGKILSRDQYYLISASKWSPAFNITRRICQYLGLSDSYQMRALAYYAIGVNYDSNG